MQPPQAVAWRRDDIYRFSRADGVREERVVRALHAWQRGIPPDDPHNWNWGGYPESQLGYEPYPFPYPYPRPGPLRGPWFRPAMRPVVIAQRPMPRRPAPPPPRRRIGKGGPRGYVRSDARLEDELIARLDAAPEIDTREVEVAVRDGVVSLRGVVGNLRDKFALESLAMSIAGVRDVTNAIRARRGMG